jgi:hypothetical protein
MKVRKPSMKHYAATLVAAASVLGIALGLAELGISADADPAVECPGVGKPESQYMGADSCALCHTKGDAARAPSKLATLDEFSIWDHRDKHRIAFKSLQSPRALAMEPLLGMNPGDAAKNRQCLACHAINLTDKSAGATLAGDEKSQRAAVAQGVSCEACHGRSSLWIDRHWKKGEWSGLKPPLAEQRYDQYGMANLRDPVRRTELCLSCHLGNIACGKFVTHDMFAAGHPPLPAFETEAFLEQMPPHWQPVPPLSRTRSVALEGLVALRASVRMLADANRLPGGQAGDFAIYDCAACHHELQIPSSRQLPGHFGGAPGRPPLRSANIVLATAAIGPQSTSDGRITPSPLDAAMARLQTATRGRPFGEPQAIEAAATAVISQLDEAIMNVQGKPLADQNPRHVIEQLCRAGAATALDYESAWQLTGSLRAVVSDWQQLAAAKGSAKFDPKIQSSIEELSELVHFPSPPESSTAPRPANRGTLWENGADFDSEQFRKKLGEIVKLLDSR